MIACDIFCVYFMSYRPKYTYWTELKLLKKTGLKQKQHDTFKCKRVHNNKGPNQQKINDAFIIRGRGREKGRWQRGQPARLQRAPAYQRA